MRELSKTTFQKEGKPKNQNPSKGGDNMADTTAGGITPPEDFPPLAKKENTLTQSTHTYTYPNKTQYANLLKPKITAPEILVIHAKLILIFMENRVLHGRHQKSDHLSLKRTFSMQL